MWTKESDWPELFPGARIKSGASIEPGAVIWSGAFIGSGAVIWSGAFIESGAVVESRAVIGSGAVITRNVHTLHGPYVATLSEHGIQIGCEPIRTADEWEALDLTEIDGDASRYRAHLIAVCAYWRAEFGTCEGGRDE